MGIDPIVIGAQVIIALQTVVLRNVDPSLPAVVSCTELTADGIRNAIPINAVIKGDNCSHAPEVQALLAQRMRAIAEGTCAAHDADCMFEYTHEFVPTVNAPDCVATAVLAAEQVVGPDNVDPNVHPMMISEDFGAFLQVVPGNFVFLGNGTGGEHGSVPLHNSQYDFNDSIPGIGAHYFAALARTRLPQ